MEVKQNHSKRMAPSSFRVVQSPAPDPKGYAPQGRHALAVTSTEGITFKSQHQGLRQSSSTAFHKYIEMVQARRLQ